MKTTSLQSSLYATVALITLCLVVEPIHAQLRPRDLVATNTHAAGDDFAWSDFPLSMSLAPTLMNFIEANDKGGTACGGEDCEEEDDDDDDDSTEGAQGAPLIFAKAGKGTKGRNICPASKGACADVCLEALSDDSSDCPADSRPKCDNEETAIGEFCQGSGECGTDNCLNNCGKSGKSGCSKSDIYRRIECKSGKGGKHGKSGKASGNPASNPGATCANVCLQALPENSDNCPANLSHDTPHCYSELTAIGEYCDGHGECGTNVMLNNCPAGGEKYDVYLRVDCDCLIVN